MFLKQRRWGPKELHPFAGRLEVVEQRHGKLRAPPLGNKKNHTIIQLFQSSNLSLGGAEAVSREFQLVGQGGHRAGRKEKARARLRGKQNSAEKIGGIGREGYGRAVPGWSSHHVSMVARLCAHRKKRSRREKPQRRRNADSHHATPYKSSSGHKSRARGAGIHGDHVEYDACLVERDSAARRGASERFQIRGVERQCTDCLVAVSSTPPHFLGVHLHRVWCWLLLKLHTG